MRYSIWAMLTGHIWLCCFIMIYLDVLGSASKPRWLHLWVNVCVHVCCIFMSVKQYMYHICMVCELNAASLLSPDNKGILVYTLQFNFVGRILGPRGMTAKDLEHYTGCKVMVRGKGSMRDKKKVRVVYLDGNLIHSVVHTPTSKRAALNMHSKLHVTLIASILHFLSWNRYNFAWFCWGGTLML